MAEILLKLALNTNQSINLFLAILFTFVGERTKDQTLVNFIKEQFSIISDVSNKLLFNSYSVFIYTIAILIYELLYKKNVG